jgi:hypothetical protein
MKTALLNGIIYEPIVPCADTDALADLGERLMLRHAMPSSIFVAPKGELNAGWVIGLHPTKPARDPRTLIAHYHTLAGEIHEVKRELWMHGTLGDCARRCWKLAQERGYLRGQLSFRIICA